MIKTIISKYWGKFLKSDILQLCRYWLPQYSNQNRAGDSITFMTHDIASRKIVIRNKELSTKIVFVHTNEMKERKKEENADTFYQKICIAI